MDIDKKEIFFRPIATAIHLPQSENGHFLLNFRDVRGFLENEDTQEPLPTILNVSEDISTFLGDDEMVPSLGDLCQAEPKGSAPHVENASAQKDADGNLSVDPGNKQITSQCSEDISTFLGEDEKAPSLRDPCQAEPKGSAPAKANTPAKRDVKVIEKSLPL